MAVGDAYVFPGFLTPVLTQLFFPKPPTTFITCFCRGERRKYAGKKSRLNRGSNSQPPGHESDTLTTEPPGRGSVLNKDLSWKNFPNSQCGHICRTLEKKSREFKHTDTNLRSITIDILRINALYTDLLGTPILSLSLYWRWKQNGWNYILVVLWKKDA